MKITRFSSPENLTTRLIFYINEAINKYNLDSSFLDLFIMSRLWLSSQDFKLPLDKVTKLLELTDASGTSNYQSKKRDKNFYQKE